MKSRKGGAPNKRLYSLLNWDGLSYPTSNEAVAASFRLVQHQPPGLVQTEVLPELQGLPNPEQAWLFPVLLDGGVVVFSLAALRASLTGSDRRWYMTLVVVVTLLSVAFNVAHATRGILSSVMAGMPLLLLFMAFESLMRQIQDSLKPPGKKAQKKQRPAVKSPSIAATASSTLENKERAASLRDQGWSKSRIAKELGVSPATVSRYLRPRPESETSGLAA